MKPIDYIIGLVLLGLFCLGEYKFSGDESIGTRKKIDTIDVCHEDTFTIKDFVLELHIQGVRYPDIILKQACLESGWFTSLAWRKNNNPFGFVGKDGYIVFNDWRSSIAYMKEWQDKYYKGGDYYQFLERVGYAKDSCYVETLKNMNLGNLKNK